MAFARAQAHGQDELVPSATRLIYETEADGDEYAKTDGQCCFCGRRDRGVTTETAINRDYFTDDSLMREPGTGHVCRACAYCMSDKTYKNGHWIATPDTYETVTTGDLARLFEDIRRGEYATPFAVHVSENPIQSEHAYLWTPVTVTQHCSAVSYGRQTVSVEWPVLDEVVAAIEDLRWCGARLDDIRSGEYRVSTIDRLGIDDYRRTDAVVEPHRRTAFLELAITLSRGASDQDRDDDG